jgi:hypothetical protein
VTFLERHPACGFVYSEHRIIDGSGAVTGRTKPRLTPGVHESESILPVLFCSNFIGTPTVLVRRSAYETLDAEYKDFLFCDHEMWLRLSARFEVGSIDSWDADYRIHGAQISSQRRVTLADEQLHVLDAIEDLPIPRDLRRRARAATLVKGALDAAERNDRHTSIERLREAVRTDPSSLLRPRLAMSMFATIGSLAFGSVGRQVLTRARTRRWETGGRWVTEPAEERGEAIDARGA